MKTKRNILPILVLLVFTLSSFIIKEKKTVVDSNNYYIYFYFHDKNDDKTIYISEAIHYEGNDKCGKDYNWSTEVKKIFMTYVEANYNDVSPYTIYTIPSNASYYYLSSKQEASEALNKWIVEEKRKGNSIVKTSFNHNCN